MPDLKEILELVGQLDDTPGENTPRERFRHYLRKSVSTSGAVRDYVETCLRTSGPQYNRALQDLINHAASLIGFDVEFGRYQGVQGQIGYDGLWRYDGLSIVAEAKTTDAYAIKTSTLVGYVDELISEKKVPDWGHALGLYVVGRADAALKQLDNAIVAERRGEQLRVSTVESVLSLAELVQDGYLTTSEAVALIRPAGAVIDETVGLISRVVSQAGEAATPTEAAPPAAEPGAPAQRVFLITPVSDREEAPGDQVIRKLLESGWYVFGESTAGRKHLKPGDHVCFYWSKIGVVAEAEVASVPEKRRLPQVQEPERFPWAFKVRAPRFFFDEPVVIDAARRSQLDAFKGRDAEGSWSWLVQGTRRVTEHDFKVLTRSG